MHTISVFVSACLAMTAFAGCAHLRAPDLAQYAETPETLGHVIAQTATPVAPAPESEVLALLAKVEPSERVIARDYPGLALLRAQVDSERGRSERAKRVHALLNQMGVSAEVPLPRELARSQLMDRLIAAFERTVDRKAVHDSPGEKKSLVVTRRDIHVFADDVARTLMRATSQTSQAATAKNGGPGLSRLLRIYYKQYLDGNFVDRNGARIAKPKFSNAIGNETITSGLTVFLEALADYAFRTPVFVEERADRSYDAKHVPFGRIVTAGPRGQKQCMQESMPSAPWDPANPELCYTVVYVYGEMKEKYLTKTEDVPTAASVNKWLKQKVVAYVRDKGKSEPGITKLELKVIRYLAGVAGDQAQLGSGLLVRSLGGFELSFVIGGHLSIGNNETLAKTADTLFEVTSRRIAEHAAYLALRGLTYCFECPGPKSNPEENVWVRFLSLVRNDPGFLDED